MEQLRIHLWHYLPLLPPKSSPREREPSPEFPFYFLLPLIPSGTPVIIAGWTRCLRVRGLCRFRGLRVWSHDQTLTRAFVQLKGPRPVSIPDEAVKMTLDSAEILSAQEEFQSRRPGEEGGVVLIPCRRSLVKTRICSNLLQLRVNPVTPVFLVAWAA